MLDSNTLAQIESGFSELYSLMAGDLVVWYSSESETTGKDLLTIRYDKEDRKRESLGDSGVIVSAAGLEDHAYQELIFLNSYLQAQSVTITVAGHFRVGGLRYDFQDEMPIDRHIVPIAGLHSLTICKVRKAVEIQETTSGTIHLQGH
jgi:hypothetical protein